MHHTKYFIRRTKIVCTIGPASGSTTHIERIIKAGMNVARLNLSHGTQQEHAGYIKTIRTISRKLGVTVAILMDIPGPKYRTGNLKAGSAILKKGAQVILTTRQVEGDKNEVPVNLPNLPRDVKAGDLILLDDGAMQLRAQESTATDVKCKVIIGGTLTPGRGVVVPGMRMSGPFITDKLKENLYFAIEEQADYIALSFVSDHLDVVQVKQILKKKNSDIPVISKIERGEALKNLEKILKASDGIMVARGDLGVDIPLEKIPLAQKDIVKKSNQAGKPVIVATQMLESMIHMAMPTRAEVTDVANAIFDGADAVMLSAETSIGKYPVESVEMMSRIACETEHRLPYESLLRERGLQLESQIDEAISYDACRTAYQLGAVAIVAFTSSGSTACRVSKYRPEVPILAITPNDLIRRRLILYWGVYAFRIDEPSSVGQLFANGARLAKELELAKPEDLIIITGGIPVGMAGTTNLLKVEKIA